MLESEAAAGALAGAASESSISESSEVGGTEADVEGRELAGPSDGANGALAVASVDGPGGGNDLLEPRLGIQPWLARKSTSASPGRSPPGMNTR